MPYNKGEEKRKPHMFAVDNNNWQGWYSYEQLRHMITLMEEEGEYQPESPEAEFVTGYNTDSYADDSCELIKNTWEEYLDSCEDDEEKPDMEVYLDILWDNFDYQLCHTWVRITNINIESDEEIRLWDRNNVKGMLEGWIEEGSV